MHDATAERRIRLYSKMVLIRRFEERVLELFARGELFGTTHTCMGQEAIAVAVAENLLPEDIVLSNHRCHGHYLARVGDVRRLMAELMGKGTGVCGGLGGSQHLYDRGFFTNGVQGNLAPVSVGIAFAEKTRARRTVTVLFVGDGTFGEGVLYESMNLASLWRVPLLIVVENNRIAQTTPVELALAGTFVGRAEGFGIPAGEIETSDVEVLVDVFADTIAAVRETSSPRLQVVNTVRLGPHSKGDDTRPQLELERLRERDPLVLMRGRLEPHLLEEVEREVAKTIADAEEFARASEFLAVSFDEAESYHEIR